MRGTQARTGKRVGAALLALFILAGIIPLDSVWFGTKQVNASEMAYIMETLNILLYCIVLKVKQ
jgi:hypothetical protein